MTLLSLLITIVIVMLILWLAQTYLPEPFRKIVVIVIVILVIAWLISFLPFGGVLNRPL